jgi:hypothetical protein
MGDENNGRPASIGDAVIVLGVLFMIYGLPFLFCAGIVVGIWKWILGL